MVERVQIGKSKTELLFDSYPYPVEQAVFGHANYEPEIVDAIEHFVRPGDCVIDVGASVGYHACFLSKLVGEEGLVFAFEPHGESYQHLMQHVHVSNKLNNVACLKMAAWQEDKPELKLYSLDVPGYSTFHRYENAPSLHSEVVEGRMLDTLIEPQNHPRFIKIDCEGTEGEVLLGAQNILRRGVDCVILEFNFHILKSTGRSDRVIREFMWTLGYDMFLINVGDVKGGFYYPMKVAPNVELFVENGHWVNVMFSTEEKVRQRYGDRQGISGGSEQHGKRAGAELVGVQP